jgi:hypothetical protein
LRAHHIPQIKENSSLVDHCTIHQVLLLAATTSTATTLLHFNNRLSKTMSSATTEEQQQMKKGGIQVICAGLGRTGTLSLTEALKALGYNPYHYVDFNHTQQWADFAQGKEGVDTIMDLIEQDGYTATLENPTSDIYQDILKRYPNAKVILTVRDTPTKFAASWKVLFDCMVITETTFRWTFPSFLGYIPAFRNLKIIRQFMGTTTLGLEPGELTHGWRDRGEDTDSWLCEQYERHNQHVIDHVPKDQLLVFNVKEGWKPLCAFLGKDLPPTTTPFPHCTINNTESLIRLKRKFQMVVYGWIPTVVTVLGAAACYYYGLGRPQQQTRKSLTAH